MKGSEGRIALLIDADNAPAAKMDFILAELARYGSVNIRRAYGNWQSPCLKRWEAALQPFAIRPVQQFPYTSGKNATDMAMVIDAMDLLNNGSMDGLAIVSSDSDFTPLVMRALTEGLKVYGFGEQKTPQSFVKACSTFTHLPERRPSAAKLSALAVTSTNGHVLQSDPALIRRLREAVDAAAGEDGWGSLAQVGVHMRDGAPFEPRTHGHRNLSRLIAATGLFDVEERKLTLSVRDKARH